MKIINVLLGILELILAIFNIAISHPNPSWFSYIVIGICFMASGAYFTLAIK
jgi:hypothetical protein